MRLRVWSLALLSGLGIWCCHELGCRLEATAPIRPLAWEPPYAAGAALKIQKDTDTQKDKILERVDECENWCTTGRENLGWKECPLSHGRDGWRGSWDLCVRDREEKVDHLYEGQGRENRLLLPGTFHYLRDKRQGCKTKNEGGGKRFGIHGRQKFGIITKGKERHLPRDTALLVCPEHSGEAGACNFSAVPVCTIAWLPTAAHVRLVVITEESNGRNDEGCRLYRVALEDKKKKKKKKRARK